MVDPLKLVCELLIEKLGSDRIKKLLSGKLVTEKPRPNRPTAYARHLKNERKLLCVDNDKDEWCVPADTLLIALDDASNEMNYSNWHTDKFDRAAEIVIRYCKDNNIPIELNRIGDGEG